MLTGVPVIAFAATTDAPAAKAFYGEALGLALTDESPYAVVFDAGGTQLRVTLVERVVPAAYTVLGWDVADIEAAVDALVARAVVFEDFDGVDQDARGIWRSPSGARVAWFRDPDGNLLSLTQF